MKISKLFSIFIFATIIFADNSLLAGNLGKNKFDESFINTITNFAIQRILTYQGILKDNLGNPVPDASYNIVFRIYSTSVGGSALWGSPSVQVTTNHGLFSTSIGPISLPFDTPYYLSLQVGADPEMAQRQTLTMTPYSASADSANHSISSDTSTTARNVLDNSITSAKIVNGTILFTDIAQNGAIKRSGDEMERCVLGGQ